MSDLREGVARAIYETAIDSPTTDPWEDAIARGVRYGGVMPPMVRQSYTAADAAIAVFAAMADEYDCTSLAEDIRAAGK